MKEVFMSASIIAAIILCFVGILKLPFKSFKEKHPKWYRAVFCIISLVLSVGLPIICQLYVLNGALYSLDFLILTITTIAGVFGLYTSYEGLGLKQLVKIIVSKVAELLNKHSDSKLAKIVKKEGIEKLTEISNKLAEEEKQKELAKTTDVVEITEDNNSQVVEVTNEQIQQ